MASPGRNRKSASQRSGRSWSAIDSNLCISGIQRSSIAFRKATKRVTSGPNMARPIGCGVDDVVSMAVGVISAVIRLCPRSEEHTSELQSLMRISYAVFCLKKNIHKRTQEQTH